MTRAYSRSEAGMNSATAEGSPRCVFLYFENLDFLSCAFNGPSKLVVCGHCTLLHFLLEGYFIRDILQERKGACRTTGSAEVPVYERKPNKLAKARE